MQTRTARAGPGSCLTAVRDLAASEPVDCLNAAVVYCVLGQDVAEGLGTLQDLDNWCAAWGPFVSTIVKGPWPARLDMPYLIDGVSQMLGWTARRGCTLPTPSLHQVWCRPSPLPSLQTAARCTPSLSRHARLNTRLHARLHALLCYSGADWISVHATCCAKPVLSQQLGMAAPGSTYQTAAP